MIDPTRPQFNGLDFNVETNPGAVLVILETKSKLQSRGISAKSVNAKRYQESQRCHRHENNSGIYLDLIASCLAHKPPRDCANMGQNPLLV